LYATKHGATRETAERIAKKIPGAVLHDLKQANTPTLADFDCVIIGSSIYVGSIHKEAKAFLAQNADILKEKNVGLFLCGFQADEEKQFFASNFSPDILAAAKAASFLGGIFDPKRAGFMERFIIKVVAKLPGYMDSIDGDKIEQFVEEMSK
jgi:menaquinone-dependent protoporphyrinogen oxidase